MKKTKNTTDNSGCGLRDVGFMARILNLDERRVQQLVKEGVLAKDARGRYDCLRNVTAYIRELQENRQGKASGLTKKREDMLDVSILREKKKALEEWGAVTQDAAIIAELVPLFAAFKSSVRELRSTLVDQILLFCKEQAEPIIDNRIGDHDLRARIQAMLAKPLDDRLQTMSVLNAWGQEKKVEWKNKKP